MRYEDFANRLDDHPFKPFRVHMSDGTMLEVPESRMVIVGKSSAVLPSRFGTDEEGRRFAEHWRTIDLVHIVQFSDLEEAVNGSGGAGKGRKRK